jgi:hypothetical protein
MNGIAFEGRDEPIVEFITISMPIRTMEAFLFCTHKVEHTFKYERRENRPTDDQLYGFAGSPSSQCIIFFSAGVTLDAAEFGIDILLSSASTS